MKNTTLINFVSQFRGKRVRTASKLLVGMFAFAMIFSSSSAAIASVTPTLSLSPLSDGDSVQLNVTADPNSSVILYYTKTNAGQQISPIGTTSSNGTFSMTISSAAYGVSANTSVHVTIGGLSGPSSATVAWPAVTTSSVTNPITLSQTGVVLSIGQSTTVTATNNTSGVLYVSNNSNPSIANVNLNGNQISITANTQGSTVVTVCATGNTTNCPSIYVTSQTTGAAALVFSQNNLTLASGQSFPVTISGGNGTYTVLNNSNSALVQTSINGNTITLTTNASSGMSSVTVCSTDMVSCGIINVTVGTVTSAAITFSQSSPTLYTGQSLNVAIYGGTTNAYYISSNSSPSVVQANVSGSTLSLVGLTNGSTTLSVCSSSGGCAQIFVTVNYLSTGGAIMLSQSTLNLATGQTLSITITGGSTPYTLPIASSNIYQASISGNVMTITGISSGSTLVSVCSGAGGCTSLALTVNGSATTTGQLTFSQSSVSLVSGQNINISIYGSGPYYISSNSNSAVASVMLNGSLATISGISSGITNITVCQTGGQCGVVSVTVGTTTSTLATPVGCTSTTTFSPITGQSCGVGTTMGNIATSFLAASQYNPSMSQGQNVSITISGGLGANYTVAYNSSPNTVSTSLSGSTLTLSSLQNGHAVIVVCDSAANCAPLSVTVGAASAVTIPAPSSSTSSAFQFTQYLHKGSLGDEVSKLQQRLMSEGVYDGPVNGTFGPLTEAAVKKYQSIHHLDQLGVVGPGTRATLNTR